MSNLSRHFFHLKEKLKNEDTNKLKNQNPKKRQKRKDLSLFLKKTGVPL